MRVFKTKPFRRFAERENVSDEDICEAAARANAERIDADLGGGGVKQRIARPGEGKSGGFRTIVPFRRETMAVFAYGFAKSDRGNIRRDELKAFRMLARDVFALTDDALARAIKNGTIEEIGCNE